MSQTFKTPKGTELPILDLRGKPYLQVAYRLVWFREDHPDWSIQTEFIEASKDQSFAKATISMPSGQIMSTAHKFEDRQGFADHREKAETGAVGRALAMIGYGTQFCADELDEGARIVDAPVLRPGQLPSQQPEAGDGGHQDDSYRITFGKFAKRSLEEVGPSELRGYVNYLEGKAAKENMAITGKVKEFIERASQYIAAFENAPAEAET